MKALYLGTFDPVTAGHLDIIKRSSKMFEELYIGIGINNNKKTLFSVDQRKSFIEKTCLKHLSSMMFKIKIVAFEGLAVEFAKSVNADVFVRGIRNVSDFNYEIELNNINKYLDSNIETIFLPTSTDLASVSSSSVKEIAKWGGDISKFLPHEDIEKAVKSVFAKD